MSSLHEHLATLRKDHEAETQALEGRLQDIEAEQKKIHHTVESLRARLGVLEEERSEVRQALLRKAAEREHRDMAEAVVSTLQESFVSLRGMGPFWRQLNHLQQQKAALLAEAPELESALQEYRGIEQILPAEWERMPPIAQKVLADTKRKLQSKLAGFLHLEEEERAAQREQQVHIQVVSIADTRRKRLYWILPLPSKSDTLPPDTATITGQVSDLLKQAIDLQGERLGYRHTKWLESDQSEYRTLVASFPFDQNTPFEPVEGSAVQECLAQSPLFQDLSLTVHLDEMSPDSWQYALDNQVFHWPVSSWYTTTDIESWERTLKVVEGSGWSEQARRLRTLLIRMVAKGKIDNATLPISILWEGAPEPHRSHLQMGVEQLLQRGVLNRRDKEKGTEVAVSLSSRALGEVQNLIKRDVTPFWAGIV